MAEGVLFDIAGNIISLACGLAAREMRLRFGAEDELQKLTKTILTIRALLLDAEEQQSKNREVSAWLEGLSDILHDADDLLDASYTEALRRQIITKDKKAKKRDGGVDWPKIAHIPELELDFNSSEESVFDLEFLNMERLCLH